MNIKFKSALSFITTCCLTLSIFGAQVNAMSISSVDTQVNNIMVKDGQALKEIVIQTNGIDG
jgi:hypothetical protein